MHESSEEKIDSICIKKDQEYQILTNSYENNNTNNSSNCNAKSKDLCMNNINSHQNYSVRTICLSSI
jgi:hypothetical protein